MLFRRDVGMAILRIVMFVARLRCQGAYGVGIQIKLHAASKGAGIDNRDEGELSQATAPSLLAVAKGSAKHGGRPSAGPCGTVPLLLGRAEGHRSRLTGHNTQSEGSRT